MQILTFQNANLDTESPACSNCDYPVESLAHIFISCPTTCRFIDKIKKLIHDKIDNTYTDPSKSLFNTCSHSNQIINYINLTAKWYISRQFQKKKTSFLGRLHQTCQTISPRREAVYNP